MTLRTQELSRRYDRGENTVHALCEVNLAVEAGEFVAIVGASGSGKSTLLNLLAGLDRPTSGAIEWNGRDLATHTPRELARFRAHEVGMIFQSFQLIAHYTARENVALAACFLDSDRRDEARPEALLERLGLGDRMDHLPADLSGGEQQRVAIARALMGEPKLLLADEPTGNLDAVNAARIAELLEELRQEGRAVVMTTHNLELAEERAGRLVRLDYGRLVEDRTTRGAS